MDHDRALPDLLWDPSEVAGVLDHPGPFLTVYLETPPTTVDDERHDVHRWSDLRAGAAAQGAPEEVLAAVDPLVDEEPVDGETLVAVVTPDGVALSGHLREPVEHDLVVWDTLPRLGPLLDSRQQDVAHVIALVDRTGADVLAVTAGGEELAELVEGDHDVVNRVRAGGWSHRRIQQRTEDSWERNAEQTADEVAAMARRVDARVILVAGERHSTSVVLERLPDDPPVHLLDGGRAAGGDDDRLATEIVHRTGDVAARETRAALAAFGGAAGRHDHAVEGADDTVAALAQGRVALLLVDDDPSDARRAWIGPRPAEVGATPGDLEGMGVEEPRQARLVDACIRAAVGTGAVVRVVPGAAEHAPDRGIGAVLRW